MCHFKKQIPDDMRIDAFEEKILRPEASYILWRMMGNAHNVLLNGRLDAPDEVIAASKEYFDENDVVKKLLDDCFEDNDFDHVLNKDICTVANAWSGESGYDLPPKQKLLQIIKDSGHPDYKNNALHGKRGLKLKEEWLQKAKRQAQYAYN